MGAFEGKRATRQNGISSHLSLWFYVFLLHWTIWLYNGFFSRSLSSTGEGEIYLEINIRLESKGHIASSIGRACRPQKLAKRIAASWLDTTFEWHCIASDEPQNSDHMVVNLPISKVTYSIDTTDYWVHEEEQDVACRREGGGGGLGRFKLWDKMADV